MTIYGLYYFNDEGEIGYFDTPDDPFYLGPHQSAVGNSLFNSNCGIGWYFFREQDDRGQVRLTFEKRCRALYDATRTRIIAVGRKAPSIVWPHNAAVFNEDGTLDHVIELPPYVNHSFDGATTENYNPEGFVHLSYHMGRIALGISFEFQWVQTRIYDPFTREWGEIIGANRQ